MRDVVKVLKKEQALHDGKRSHILVMSKDDVIKRGVFGVLEDWLKNTPSALVLKGWEREYEQAKNAMFYDFYTKSPYWPVMLWNTFQADSLPASDELGRLITRIIFSRMTPFHLDLSSFVTELDEKAKEAGKGEYRKKLIEVLESERFVPAKGLHDDSIAPGDVFKKDNHFFINIRPDCDCVPRGQSGDNLELYLLQGDAAPNNLRELLDRKYATLREKEFQAAVFSMYEGKTVVFNLRDLAICQWRDMRTHRIGRLLPPFLTRLQQRYASYLQRPGLPRIPIQAMPEEAV